MTFTREHGSFSWAGTTNENQTVRCHPHSSLRRRGLPHPPQQDRRRNRPWYRCYSNLQPAQSHRQSRQKPRVGRDPGPVSRACHSCLRRILLWVQLYEWLRWVDHQCCRKSFFSSISPGPLYLDLLMSFLLLNTTSGKCRGRRRG